MDEYIIVGGELYHYGVKGMKWGHRRAQKYQRQAGIARSSAKEWDEMAGYARAKSSAKNAKKAKIAADSAKEWDEMAAYAKSKGNLKKANKYAQNAKADRVAAKKYDRDAKAGVSKKADKYVQNAKDDRAAAKFYDKQAKAAMEPKTTKARMDSAKSSIKKTMGNKYSRIAAGGQAVNGLAAANAIMRGKGVEAAYYAHRVSLYNDARKWWADL